MNVVPFMYALGWSLMHSLWQGALICGAAYIILSVFRMSARAKVNLIFAFLCLLLIGFASTYMAYWPSKEERSIANEIMMPVSDLGDREKVLTFFSLERYFPYLSLIYLLGFLFQSVLLIGGYIRIIRLKKSVKHTVPSNWAETFSRLSTVVQLSKKVGFYFSEYVNTPTVIGYFRPIILFPIAAFAALDMKQVEAILIHELTHIRRHDYVLNLLKCLIETVLFFNPFVWILTRMMEQEREHSCDDEVLKQTDDALSYAHALLALENLRFKNIPPLALGALGNRAYLLARIKRMTIMKTKTMHVKQQLAALLFILAGALGLAWASPSTDSVHQSNPAPIPPVVKAEPPKAPPIAPKPAPLAVPLPPIPPKPAYIPDTPKIKSDTTQQASRGIDKSLDQFFSSKEWKDYQQALQMNSRHLQEWAQKIQQQWNTPEWKHYQKEIAQHAAKSIQMNAFFASPTWKSSVQEVQDHAKRMGLLAIQHDSAYFDSDEWKKQEREMANKSKKLQELTKQFEAKFHTAEMKKERAELAKKSEIFRVQAETLRNKMESSEFKAQQEALRKKGEQLRMRAETMMREHQRNNIP